MKNSSCPPVKLQAAADEAPQRDGAPEAKRSDVPFMGSMGIGKEAGAVEAPASSDREELHQTGEEIRAGDTYGTRLRPALRLVMGGRGMSTAQRRQWGSPAPAVLRPMLLIVGGRDHHAASSVNVATAASEKSRAPLS